MDYHQANHHHHQTTTSIYLVLGIITILPILWDEYGSNQIGQWHPFYQVGGKDYPGYSLYWYIGLTAWSLIPVLYIVVALIAKSIHNLLLVSFLVYQTTLFLDWVLVYAQSDVRTYLAIILAVYMAWYHYKYD